MLFQRILSLFSECGVLRSRAAAKKRPGKPGLPLCVHIFVFTEELRPARQPAQAARGDLLHLWRFLVTLTDHAVGTRPLP